MASSIENFKRELIKNNLDLDIIYFNESTKTSQDAAKVLNTEVAKIGKSIVFKTETGKFIVVIASGKNKINEKLIEKEVNEKLVKTNPDEIKEKIGYPIGGIPPFGHKNETIIFFDEELLSFDEIFCAAGTPNSVFKISPKELLKINKAKVIKIN
jgi:prolyl-tRNA editing enzyme YbaK/EbsC (Cys-tRNA(Pro) deacylase)